MAGLLRARDTLARNVVVLARNGFAGAWDMDWDQYLDTIKGINLLHEEEKK
jgi:hypothetical protein